MKPKATHFKNLKDVRLYETGEETENVIKRWKSYVLSTKTFPRKKDINRLNIQTNLVASFKKSLQIGPEYVCTCCEQLLYRSSVLCCIPSRYNFCDGKITHICLNGIKSVSNREWICRTCNLSLLKGKMPSCSKANLERFPEKPKCLNLTPLEERLISPRIPFMQIRELPRGGQMRIHGGIVNVPADVSSSVNKLPRLISESETIPVKLKRKLSFKHYYSYESVRPNKVLAAAQYLSQNSLLFQSEGVSVDDEWLDKIETDRSQWSEFSSCNIPDERRDTPNENSLDTSKQEEAEDIAEDDGWTEEEKPSGLTDTLLQEADSTQSIDSIINVAPGEGNQPLGIFLDKDSEYLSFPTIYCGMRRSENSIAKVHYSTICKWELRNRDRRVASCIPNIFFKLKKLQINRVQDTAQISLRKCKMNGKKYTAGELKSDAFVRNLINIDEGYKVLRNLRGSPPYFQKCQKDLFAMIRQLGYPTWFASFSAAF